MLNKPAVMVNQDALTQRQLNDSHPCFIAVSSGGILKVEADELIRQSRKGILKLSRDALNRSNIVGVSHVKICRTMCKDLGCPLEDSIDIHQYDDGATRKHETKQGKGCDATKRVRKKRGKRTICSGKSETRRNRGEGK